ncbi:MAG: SCP2 sterol-binding domain-containing protein [Dokdonella sp.]|jgi:ubiquinone biosynthesis accessory factor UbiJ|uniref:ubiquinone biosynthesis accessory factor UbiJ n=1 Tax=Dokdonella sp. TaxID=2291710 RepID=UPI002C865D9A|nr:SCP2 sterol-binding domain-containing protein [Dokdonella sp.]HNV09302.1 SCP2 sterol-binding domain-containing protein [Dokdonella sp.]HPW04130.1 SCP2 sterol-binding domain-containing protein [Dokdonella sp.]
MNPSTATTERAPNPILGMLGRGLEATLNRVLSLDPETLDALRALDDRSITIAFKGSALAMRIAVDSGQLRVGPAFAGDSQLRVSATPGSLLAMAAARLRGDADAALPPGQVEISGDADLARRIERLASRFEPDFDEAFARAFGDVIGFQLARGFRGALAGVGKSTSRLLRTSVEYLVEESRDLVARPELEQFFDEVDALRERADRLAARVRRIDPAARA